MANLGFLVYVPGTVETQSLKGIRKCSDWDGSLVRGVGVGGWEEERLDVG